MSDIYLNDIGTVLHFTVMENGVALDISTATETTLKFLRKDKTTFERTAVFETDGTDGMLKYTSIDQDFNQTGKWSAQLYIVMPTWTGHTSKITFNVLAPIT